MPLTDADIRKAKPTAKVARLQDGLGLYLEIAPSGIKAWRLRIRSKAGDTIKTIGYYPEMSLAQARKVQAASRLNGSAAEAEAPPPLPKPTFREIAQQWHTTKKPGWAPHHADNVWGSFERDIFQIFGDEPIDTIEAPTIGALLDGIQARGVHNRAHDIRQRIERVFSYAKAKGIIKDNPASDMREVMQAIPPATPRPAVTTVAEAQAVLGVIQAQRPAAVVLLATYFQALTAQRSGEIALAQWHQFEDLDGPEPIWKIPKEQMKMKRDHWVPLASQTVGLLDELRKLTGSGAYLFPSATRPAKPMEIGSLRYLLLKAGYAQKHCPHGWRSTFSTVMNGRRIADNAAIELMLAHVKGDKVAGIYDRAEHMPVRREIAQEWADLLIGECAPFARIVECHYTPTRRSP